MNLPPAYSYHQRKLIVAALRDVIDLRRLAEPEIPIEVFRRGDLGEGAAAGATVDAHGDLADIAQQPLLHHVHGAEEQVAASLRRCVPT